MKIQKALEKLDTTRAKFDDATYYPRSARCEFVLKASNELQETAEFRNLVTASDAATLAFKEAQKNSMLATIDLEIQHLKKKKQLLFYETLDALCELLVLDKGHPASDNNRDALVHLLATEHAVQLGKHLDLNAMTMVASFERDYLNHDHQMIMEGTMHQPSAVRVLPLVPDLRNLLKYIFVSSWDIILSAQTRRHNELQLQRAVQLRLAGAATAQAAAVIDNEPPPADMHTLKALISNMVGDHSKKILDKLSQMEQRQSRVKQTPKNEHASTVASAAARKKKQQDPKKKKKQQQPKSKDQAAASGNATSTGKSAKKKRGGRQQRAKKT
jgi:cation transport regulator ChaB